MEHQNTTPKQIHCSTLHSLVLFSIIFVLCQHASASTAHSTNQTDQLALLEFKHQIADDPHGFLNSWNDSLHFCQWQGVECGLRHQRVIGLNLSCQNILGNISPQIGNLTFLRFINLQDNLFHGEIPQQIGCLSRLRLLDLTNNTLGGTVPVNLSRCSDLRAIYLNENRLVGTVPVELGSLNKLASLNLASNNLTGFIPHSIGNCKKLKLLDLSQNNLIGSIPKKVISISSLSISLSLSRNSLTGPLPLEVRTLKNLIALDVSDNKLTGSIPDTIAECLSLEYLYIQGNFFQGIVPPALAALKGIRALDLSRNNLSGKIPKDMEKLPYLHYLNLSFNELEGEVPKKGVFENASAISIIGNSKLFGGIKELQLPSRQVKAKKLRVPPAFKVVIIVFGVVLFLILISIVVVLRWRRREARKDPFSIGSKPKSSKPKRLLRISYHDLYRATAGFSLGNLIGSGSFGSVYEGKLHQQEEKIVAVKVLNLQKTGASKSFVAECRALRNIRHRNLVKILTCCSSIDFKGNQFKALVYEFMANGSLDRWLHPNVPESSRTLSLIQRLNIATDVASAMHYLHVHCDLKPSNILLDNELTAHIGDFGLARLISTSTNSLSQAQTSSMGIKGSVGYAAPEYGMGAEATTYGDVYSYGVLLLEIFTGKRPTDDIFEDDLNLHNYVKMAVPDRVMEIADPKLSTTEAEIEETASLSRERDNLQKRIASVVNIGLACSTESPKERMCIKDVLKELNRIRGAFLGDRIIRNRPRIPA